MNIGTDSGNLVHVLIHQILSYYIKLNMNMKILKERRL